MNHNAKMLNSKLINYLMIQQKFPWLNHALPREHKGVKDIIKVPDNTKDKAGVNRFQRCSRHITKLRDDNYSNFVLAASRNT